MNLYPAIDILGGNAVRLVKGDFDAKKVYDEDPLSAARGWVRRRAREYLHVVDLDGAKAGEPVNLEQLRRDRRRARRAGPVRRRPALGAARSTHALAAGAARVILGTAAFTDPELLSEALDAHGPERVLVVGRRARRARRDARLAADDRDPARATRSPALRERGVRDFVFTNIDRDGMLDGADREEVDVGRARGRARAA